MGYVGTKMVVMLSFLLFFIVSPVVLGRAGCDGEEARLRPKSKEAWQKLVSMDRPGRVAKLY